jgi:predicted DNA-binding transcriptional regulator YafY/predicted kinase
MQKIVIINRGIPASGKSSFAKQIVETLIKNGLNAISCSTDDFFMLNGEYMFDASKLRKYHIKNQEKFKNALKDDFDLVICDNTNIEPWEAKPYYELAKEFDYRVVLMDFESRDIEEHFKSQANEEYKHHIPFEILQKMDESYRNYEELTLKSSYPTHLQPKREYSEITKKVEVLNEVSELFYYDELIKIQSKEYFKIKKIVGDMIFKKMRDYSKNEIKLIPNEYKFIMQEFGKRVDKTLTAYELKEFLGKSPKQIERYMEALQDEFHNIINIKVGRKNGYKLIDNYDAFIEAFKNMDELDELFYLAQESNPQLFKMLEYQFDKNEDVFMFRNPIFEHVKNREIFNNLKTAIKVREYRKIKLFDENDFQEVKCLRLVFVDNNWYLAYISSEDKLKLARISFIEDVRYATKISYQKVSVEKHLKNLKNNLQNSMTLFDIDQKIATLKATPNISRYFKKGMKRFLASQKFQEELDDGSVVFTIDYTQSLEILPFIQRWLPDLVILEPRELKEIYHEKLSAAIKNLTKI